MQDGKKIVTNSPLKCAQNRDDFSVSMKLETYPNRDSLVFMDRFGMNDCTTFIRGTLRFTGFSSIISAFHDIGLTSDDPAEDSVTTLRGLLESRLKLQKANSNHPNKAKIEEAINQLLSADADKDLMARTFATIDLTFIQDPIQVENAIKGIIKTFVFLGFFDDSQKVQVKDSKTGKSLACLDVLGQVMSIKLGMNDQDRDLVVMRHVFFIQDPATNQKWEHTSTMVASGKSKADKGQTIMSVTVGLTTALATRLVLENRISERGVLSPMTPEIYEPILAKLEERGIYMVEESANPKAMAKMQATHNRARL